MKWQYVNHIFVLFSNHSFCLLFSDPELDTRNVTITKSVRKIWWGYAIFSPPSKIPTYDQPAMNSSTTVEPSVTESPHPGMLYTAAVILVLAQIASLVGNIFLFITIFFKPSLRASSLVFIVSLSMCDVIYVLLVLAPQTANYFFLGNAVGSYCNPQNYFRTMADGSTMWHVTFASLNQYVMTSQHEFFDKISSDQATGMQLLFSWALPILVMVSGMVRNLGNSTYTSKQVRCVFYRHRSTTLIAFQIILCVLLPGCITFTCSGVVFCNSRKVKTQVWAQETNANTGIKDDHINLTKIFTAIATRVTISSTILIISREIRNQTSADALVFLDLLIWLMDTTTPYLYIICSDEFRGVFVELITCKFKFPDDDLPIDSTEDLKYPGSATTRRSRAYSTTVGIGLAH